MKKTKYKRIISITYIKTAIFVMIVNFFLFPYLIKTESQGDNIFDVSLCGEVVGTVENMEKAEEFLQEARRKVAAASEELVFIDAPMEVKGRTVDFEKIDSEQTVVSNMQAVLSKNKMGTRKRAYTVKINEFTVHLGSSADVQKMLQASIDKFDSENKHGVELILDPTRELNVLTTSVFAKEEKKEEAATASAFRGAGVELLLSEEIEQTLPDNEKSFDDFDYGLIDLNYGDYIEVVEAYLTESEITPINEAIEFITKDQEKNTIYEVVAGDTLSEIALTTNIPLDKIIELNETLESENSTIRVGDELIITIPEPELSVERKEELYYEEIYDAPIEYIYNDAWYTTDSVVRQQPSAGFRKVVAVLSYRNQKVVNTELLKEEVVIQAVPKIVEVGTKIPPTYIKPLSGGRFTSGYKWRWGRMHKGVDWAAPVGTAIMASNAGVVEKAGWGSGYGYVVYIRHADGRQTRYGHLSRVLVRPGESVKQGQKIALSGNTGRSTGPHLHFEILINGSQVDPLKYLN